jgi:hypothetical protein
MFLFESSVLFIFRIDSLSTRETIIPVLFCLFSGFYCFLSHIYIFTGTIMSDQNNRPLPLDVELKFQMQAMTQMMERMNFVMENVCDKLNRLEKHGNEDGWG